MADPRYAKVNVKAEQQQQARGDNSSNSTTTTSTTSNMAELPMFDSLPPGITPSTVDRLQAQRKMPAQPEVLEHLVSSAGEFKPRTQPINRVKKSQSQVQQDPDGRVVNALPNRTHVFNNVPLS